MRCAVMEVEKPTLATIWSSKGVSGRLFMLGEAVHIFRPLVYVLMIRKFGMKSWTPWLVSLAVEITSLGIHSHATDLNHRAGKVHHLSSAERDEVRWFRFYNCLFFVWFSVAEQAVFLWINSIS
jgi:peroxin-16